MANNDAINYNARLWAYAPSSSSSSSSSSNGTEDDERLERNRLQDEAILRRSRQRRVALAGLIPPAHEILSEGDVQRGGSVMGRRYTRRERSSRKELIMRDYFVDQPKFEPHKFRRRYRMQRELFWHIYQGVVAFDPYFTDRVDGFRREGVSGLQKCMAAIHQLASGCSSDACDEYHQLGDSTAMESLYRFTDAVIGVFEGYYLRRPTNADINFLLQQNAARGFPGMLGSIDCMHWVWKNCPTRWSGQHVGHHKEPTVILEAVADKDLWIWHMFFGMAGSNNDLNVLQQSDVFDDIIHGYAAECHFQVNGNDYNLGYFLSDGIYPKWSTLIQAPRKPATWKERHFKERQESARKDVERAFGVLQARWHIIRQSARSHSVQKLGQIMKCCIILHNMIVDNERNTRIENWRPDRSENQPVIEQRSGHHYVLNLITQRRALTDKYTNARLYQDLVQHIWDWDGNQPEERNVQVEQIYDPDSCDDGAADE